MQMGTSMRISKPTAAPPPRMSPWRTCLRSWTKPRRNSLMQGSSADGSTQKKKKKMDGGGERRRVRVLVVDDHTMFREGLASMLASSYGDEVEIVGKTNLGEDAVALAHENNPDVLIMQVDKTLKQAKDTLKQIREGSSSSSGPKVVI